MAKSELLVARENARLTQAQLGERMGLSQPQIKRMEDDPDNVTKGQFDRWMEICGDISRAEGLLLDDPRVELEQRLHLIRNYAAVEPRSPSELYKPDLHIQDIVQSVERLGRKPRVGAFGKFDAGKSRLLNTLIGGNHLPASYQPTTSVLTLVRHASDKPEWQTEPVWFMGAGFDFNLVDDETHCKTHRLFGGTYEALSTFGTHDDLRPSDAPAASAAIVYIDAPVLQAVDFIDAPGYGNDANDDKRAEMSQSLVDVVLYLSPNNGFMDAADFLNLKTLLRTTPVLDVPVGTHGDKALANVFILCTRAHQVAPEISEILDKATRRTHKDFVHVLAERLSIVPGRQAPVLANAAPDSISSAQLRKRLFPFSVEDISLRADFQASFSELVAQLAPKASLDRMQDYIQSAKKTASAQCQAWMSRLEQTINNREQAKRDYDELMADEPRRKARVERRRVELLESVANNKAFVLAQIPQVIHQFAGDIDRVEAMIKSQYGSEKKEAKSAAPAFVIDTIQSRINGILGEQAKAFSAEVDSFLDDFGPKIGKESSLFTGWDFDTKAAFIGALSGGATVGALAVWASIAAAGSNLGGYILIAQIAGWLSSLGISLGSYGSIMATVAALGGPATLAVAVGVLVAMGIGWALTDSWERALAKRIVKGIESGDVKGKISAAVSKFWDDTVIGLNAALEGTEKRLQAHLEALGKLAQSVDVHQLEVELAHAQEIRDFFAGIPWRTIPQ
jgi:transcriptional regulator with XRE-family HTH domain